MKDPSTLIFYVFANAEERLVTVFGYKPTFSFPVDFSYLFRIDYYLMKKASKIRDKFQKKRRYLALRTAPAYDDSNVIAKIYQNGTELLMTGRYDGSYGYCYVPAFDMYGWVNTDYTF